jgi:glycine/D-amino acid oxidase-like deaminating enzyme
MLQTLGIDTWLLAGEELLQLAPYLAADDISWVAYEPGPGFADPHLTRTGFAQAARRNGAHVLQGFPPSESR